MSDKDNLHKEAMDVLKETSRTFFIPINLLPEKLKETVSSAYLCMRAIDEIEDHPQLPLKTKNELLMSISQLLQTSFCEEDLEKILLPYKAQLPEVSLRLAEWIKLCPTDITENVLQATSTMAEGMANWAEKEWRIKDELDLDDYTYYVAGLVGVMLTDIWKWYDGTDADKKLAIAFGRGLQSVNILRNYKEDDDRGVSFFPEGWTLKDMFEYADKNLALANLYIKDITSNEIRTFCSIPLELAFATLKALKEGKEKMTRASVTEVVNKVVNS